MATIVEQRGGVAERWWTEHRRCPVCDPPMYTICGKPLYRVPADPPLAECDVVTCSNCGFTFSDTSTTQAEFDRYYATSAKYGPEVTGAASWNAERYHATAERLCDELLPVPAPSLLDVGGAAGGLAAELRRFGIGCVVSNETLAGLSPVPVKWGCVTLCHVLEHVRDLDPAMRNLAAIAEAVYAEVPDAARYHEFCESPWQQFNSEHINHFTAEHLRRLFERHGFAQVACGRGECGDPPPHLSPYVWGFFERAKPAADAVRTYCDRSATLWQRIEEKVADLIGPLNVWGLGQLARKLTKPLSRLHVVGAIDSSATGEFAGCEIQTPDKWMKVGNTDKPILVTTIQHRESVLEDITRLGLKNEVVTLP